MSLRSALMATLLLGDQYGLQLYGEVVARTSRTTPLNVGQVYATLDRLGRAGLVRVSGATADGLTLYGLTQAGHDAGALWAETPATPLDWNEMREQVLLVSSLPGHDPRRLVAAYRAAWLIAAATRRDDPVADLGADHALATAAAAWLAGLDLEGRQRPLAPARPRRGRRPAP